MRYRLTCVLALAAAGGNAAAQAPTPRPTPFVERVEVNVRTVLVRITDTKGRPPSPSPGPEDLEVLEDGAPMKVLGVDPARPPETRPTAGAAAAPAAPAPSPTEPAAPPAPIGIPQHLYADTALLGPNSVARLAAEFEKSLDIVLANGPLEIVVADPQPRQLLRSTRDREAVRQGLRELARSASGKQSLVLLRRQAMDNLRNQLCINGEMPIRSAAEQELRLIQDSLNRLVQWAVSLGGQRPDVVYFGADGFDSDVTESYRQVFLQRASGTQNPLCAVTEPPEQISQALQAEYASKGGELVGDTGRALAALGVQAVPLALGGNFKDLGTDASVQAHDGYMSRTGVVPLFARPIEPLRTLADATGGEVVTSTARLPTAFDAYGSAFVVSFRSEHAPDGRAHDLRITSRRENLTVRGPQYLAEGSADSIARGLTIRALHEPPASGGLAVRLAIDGVTHDGKKSSGVLHVDVDLATLAPTLAALGGGRMRTTIAVEVTGAKEPFTTKQEFDVPANQAGWGVDIPIGWPQKAETVAVTVEELKTGTRGTAAVDIPK